MHNKPPSDSSFEVKLAEMVPPDFKARHGELLFEAGRQVGLAEAKQQQAQEGSLGKVTTSDDVDLRRGKPASKMLGSHFTTAAACVVLTVLVMLTLRPGQGERAQPNAGRNRDRLSPIHADPKPQLADLENDQPIGAGQDTRRKLRVRDVYQADWQSRWFSPTSAQSAYSNDADAMKVNPTDRDNGAPFDSNDFGTQAVPNRIQLQLWIDDPASI